MINCDIETFKGLILSDELFFFLGILGIGVLAYFLMRMYVNPLLIKVLFRRHPSWAAVVEENKAFRQLAYLVPALIFYTVSQHIQGFFDALHNVLDAYIALNITLLMGSLVRTANHIYELHPISQEKPVKSYSQLLVLVIYILGGIVAICQLTDTSPTVFLGGAVAIMAAVLLVFRDTILSFIASMQLASNNLIQKGDWIEVKNFGADGTVVDIALHVIRVQNFDKTIVTIPTYKVMETGFRNWRGMFESGGRQIKKSILIDQTSVRFLHERDIKRIYADSMVKRHLPPKEELLTEHNADSDIVLTNLGVLRTYLMNYLKSHPKINLDMTLLVRLLEPTPSGIPLQIYTYTSDTRWAYHEQIQADILEHVIALLAVFELKLFQNPTDTDLQTLDRLSSSVLNKD